MRLEDFYQDNKTKNKDLEKGMHYFWLKHIKGCDLVDNDLIKPIPHKIEISEKIKTVLETFKKYYRNIYHVNLLEEELIEDLIRDYYMRTLGLSIQDKHVFVIETIHEEVGFKKQLHLLEDINIIERVVRLILVLLQHYSEFESTIILTTPTSIVSRLEPLNNLISNINLLLDKLECKIKVQLIVNLDIWEKVKQPINKILGSESAKGYFYI